ncbi:hypothetical protein ACHQM5_018955 [Ranunculus cassubicifolius]
MSLKVPCKKWMSAPQLSSEYVEGARSFIKFTQNSLAEELDWYCCPCLICHLCQKRTAESIYEHIICNGIDLSYTSWVHHGEPFSKNSSSASVLQPEVMFPRTEEMINDTFRHCHPSDVSACLDEVQDEDEVEPMNNHEDVQNNPQEDANYKKLIADALQPMYPSCKAEDSKLSATIELLSSKVRYQISDNGFTEI